MNILFLASELHPLIKTGGLADVAGSLPQALRELDHDVRVLLPAYPQAKAQCTDLKPVAELDLLDRPATLLDATLPDITMPVWLLEAPHWFDRPENPYLSPEGEPWPDNAERFGGFCWAGFHLALDRLGLDWQPDVVHCNDWQTGLVPALLSQEKARPATVFTIHNLAYQGVFPPAVLSQLKLPRSLWHMDGLEFHSQLSFIKGGLMYADRINTVSPTYAKEIQTPAFGCGLEGVLKARKEHLSGILNGIDTHKWNPATDSWIPQVYDRDSLQHKSLSKAALQKHFKLPQEPDTPLLAFISRLVPQKGIDLILQALTHLIDYPLQFVFLGSGNSDFEHGLFYWSRRYPDRVAVHIGFDEPLSHLVEAGADIFLMPSRFEPCGLNQMYSQRYGTVPVVHRTGGLADTVVDATPDRLDNHTATGIGFSQPVGGAFQEAVKRAWLLYSQKDTWRDLQQTGMAQDFSWKRSAAEYHRLYQQVLNDLVAHPKTELNA
ncbi:MAG: glycogen synthase GlgA [Methylohalobius sp. ZOD2]|nr:glycogen synthase GlgA [Methylothermaceae bacterium]